MSLIREIYAKLREAWPLNRFVVAITPLITLASAAISGAVATWVAVHFPGLPPIDPGWLAGIFAASGVTTATSFFLMARKWLDGHIQYEKLLADPSFQPLVQLPKNPVDPPLDAPPPPPAE